jgi:heme-degrading monooxygenase HmoA
MSKPAHRLRDRNALARLLTPLTAAALAFVPMAGANAQAMGGDGYAPASAVAAVVKVPLPWYALKVLVWSKMRNTISSYESIPGLSFKAYAIAQADGRFGGLYLWRDLPSARAWFNDAWFERVERERGVKGQVQFYEVPVAIDNVPGGTSLQADSASVSTIVTVNTPAGVSKARLVQEFQAAVPSYQAVPGLLRKHFIITDDGKFGGIYHWKDRASADQWFTDAWKARVRKTYGSDATLEWFDTAILTPSKLAANRPAIPGL